MKSIEEVRRDIVLRRVVPPPPEPGMPVRISLAAQVAYARRLPPSPEAAAIAATLDRCRLLQEISEEMKGRHATPV
jgi:hypothetical protein